MSHLLLAEIALVGVIPSHNQYLLQVSLCLKAQEAITIPDAAGKSDGLLHHIAVADRALTAKWTKTLRVEFIFGLQLDLGLRLGQPA